VRDQLDEGPVERRPGEDRPAEPRERAQQFGPVRHREQAPRDEAHGAFDELEERLELGELAAVERLDPGHSVLPSPAGYYGVGTTAPP
jgi:hypothetical protein